MNMQNIQGIDSVENCVYLYYRAVEKEFYFIFTRDTNIAFSEDVWEREDENKLSIAFSNLWTRPLKNSEANGIHGIIFCCLQEMKKYYPTLRDEEAINPGGGQLRKWQP